MSHMLLQQEVTAEMPFLFEAEVAVTTDKLTEGEREEVLPFLAARPIHTVVMAGSIRDNGLVSPLNRVSFYGCRNQGLGSRALGDLSNALPADKSSLRWFVNAHNLSVQSFYEKAGCVVRARFGKIYL